MSSLVMVQLFTPQGQSDGAVRGAVPGDGGRVARVYGLTNRVSTDGEVVLNSRGHRACVHKQGEVNNCFGAAVVVDHNLGQGQLGGDVVVGDGAGLHVARGKCDRAISGDCAADGTITLALGDVKSCTITNDDILPKLTVTKVVVIAGTGTKTVADFSLFVDAGSVTSGVQNTFNAGAHTVSETVDPDYASTISGDCASDGTITLAPGDVKSCTITNNDVGAKLTVTKVVNGGAKTVSDFPLFVDAVRVTSGVQFTFLAGVHTVGETADPDYAATITGDCAADGSITLALGDVKSCTITNDDVGAKLTGDQGCGQR